MPTFPEGKALVEFKVFHFEVTFSPTFDSKRGIHKGENVEGRKNAARLLFCERNLSPRAALFGYFPAAGGRKVTEKIYSRDTIKMAISSSVTS